MRGKHSMAKSDVELLAVAQSEKDPHAFEQILLRYEKLIYHIARRYFPNAEDAEDASQEAVIRIYKGLNTVTLEEPNLLKSWICTVTANACLDSLRKRRVETVALVVDEPRQVFAIAQSAEDAALARARVKDIMSAIYALPDDHRMVIILRDLQGLSYEALGEALKIGPGTVKSRLSRARAALKIMLE